MSTSTHIPAAATRVPRRRTGQRMRTLFGRDWNVAYPFVLPMVLVMVGLIL